METTTARSKGWRALWTLALAGALSACVGGGDGGEDSAAAALRRLCAWCQPGATSEPINLTLTLDAQRAASATVGIAGGSISATGADGTTFKLDIPANAVPEDTLITMTPVSAAGNLPLNSLGGAVHFAPEGLSFYKLATLTIVPSQPIPLGNQVLFGFSGNGKDLALASPANMGGTITVAVAHFSGAGVGNGTSEQKAAILKSIASRVEARIESQVANLLSEARKNGTSFDASALNELIAEYEASVVRNRITAAGAASASCADGEKAVQTYLGYERQRALLGLESSTINATGLMDAVTAKCRAEAVAQCKAQRKTAPLVQFDLRTARQYALMGLPSDGMVRDSAYYTQTCLSDVWKGTGTFETTGNIAGWWGNVEMTFALDTSFKQDGQVRYKLQTGKLTLNYDASKEPGSNCTGSASASADLLPEDADFTIRVDANTYRGLGIVDFGRPPLPVMLTCRSGKNVVTFTQDMSTPEIFFGDPPDGSVERAISADGNTVAGQASQEDVGGSYVWRWTLTRQ